MLKIMLYLQALVVIRLLWVIPLTLPFTHSQNRTICFRAVESSIDHVLLPTLFNVVNNIIQQCSRITNDLVLNLAHVCRKNRDETM